MAARIIDGNQLASSYRDRIRSRVEAVRKAGGHVRLDAVLVESGDNGARLYAENQAKTCAQLGIEYKLHRLAHGAGYDDIAGRVLLLSSQDDVSVIKMLASVSGRADGAPFLRGKLAVVVGAGDVVGKPIAVLLMRQEATVVSCNKWTPMLPEITRQADELVAAAGVAGLISSEMVK